MDRAKYNSCMVPFMKGGGPDRKLRFCIGAKLCSQKSKTEAEAREVCLLPKEPKPLKVRGSAKSCEKDMRELAQCAAGKVDMRLVSTARSLETALADALRTCKCHS